MDPLVDPITGLIDRPIPRPYPFGPPTIAALLEEPLADAPDHVALIDDDRTWTYQDLDRVVGRAAAALAGIGVGPGSRVAWTLPNSAELVIGFLATQRLGAIWLGINESLAHPEKQYLLDDADVTHHVATDSVLEAIGGTAVSVRPDEWAQMVAAATPARPAATIDPHAPAAIAYTSGTTGRPKGVVHSQHNLLWPGLVSSVTDPAGPRERLGTPLALTILNMMVLGPVSALLRRSTAVILHSPRSDEFAGEVARFGVTRTLIVPTIAHDLVDRDDIAAGDLATLESVILGGAAAPAALRRAFAEKFGVRAVSSYGLTEAPSGVARESTDDPIEDPVAGHSLAPFAISILDGEICIAAATTGDWAGTWTPMLGYWKRPDETAAALADGVLHTGDRGSLDDRGRLMVSGRGGDLIVRGGANIDPAEVEAAIGTHPHVAEVAVFAVPDDRLGQRVAAVIVGAVPRPDLDAIRTHCASELAAYKVPERIELVAALPRNAMGKVIRSDIAGW